MSFRGSYYRWPFFYQALDFIQAGGQPYRFRLLTEYIQPNDVVLDLCAGPGVLKRFVPGHEYIGVDASTTFLSFLKKNGVRTIERDLHQGLENEIPKVNLAVMIVSLYHFRATSASALLEELKKIADRVVIIERVVQEKDKGWRPMIRDYLCSQKFYRPVNLFTKEEFQDLMKKHNYRVFQKKSNHWVALFEKS